MLRRTRHAVTVTGFLLAAVTVAAFALYGRQISCAGAGRRDDRAEAREVPTNGTSALRNASGPG